ncbi:MAG TPA: hypothetical protein VL262_17525 [Vicinamibacterales bacterium]|jgi:opacity protein-like surface antigen|nr:hypothetical protein [Vicinamibacterales bacterium]
MKKALLLALAVMLAPSLANAQIRQVRSSPADGNNTVNFTIGYFALKGLDSRVNDDVLLGDLQNGQPLLFEVKDFNGASIGGEYLFGIGSNFEAGVGLGFYQRTVPSVYANLTHSNGDEIQQDLKLRTVPVTFTGRFLLLPRGSAAEPYVGAGIAAVRWRYSETGEFVDIDNSIFPARYVADGTATGPIVLAGIRFPFDAVVAGGEVRWQKVEGDIPSDIGMLGTKIDLGGWTTNFTLGVRF